MDGFSYWTLTDVMFIGIFVWTGLSIMYSSVLVTGLRVFEGVSTFRQRQGNAIGHEALRRAPSCFLPTTTGPSCPRRLAHLQPTTTLILRSKCTPCCLITQPTTSVAHLSTQLLVSRSRYAVATDTRCRWRLLGPYSFASSTCHRAILT